MSIIKSGWLTIGRWWSWFALRAAIFLSFLWVWLAIFIVITAIFGGEIFAEIPNATAFVFITACYIILIFSLVFLTLLLFLGVLIDSAINWIGNLFGRSGKAGAQFVQDVKTGAGLLWQGLKEGGRKAAREVVSGAQKVIRPLIDFGRWIWGKVRGD